MPHVSTDLVRSHQYALHALGHDPGPIDGDPGRSTRSASAAWLAFARAAEAEERPAARPIRFAGAARRLDDIDLPRLGHRIGVGEDEIHAVIDVEARGSGFDAQGRVVMLFEPHKFYEQLGPGAARDRAVSEGLAYPKWGAKPYPRDSYPRLLAAIEIHERAALRSASWGLGQIMGFNASLAGYDSAREMVEHFAEDEDRHLEAMVAFIVSGGLDDELRRHDWQGFARGYNGPGYAAHGYHTKLAAAYAKWARIPDTPSDPAEEALA